MIAAHSGPLGHGGCLVASPEPTRMCLYPPFNFTFTKALLFSESPCSMSSPLCKTALSKVCQGSLFLRKETWGNPLTQCVGESCSSSGHPVWFFHCEGQHLYVQLFSPGILVDPARSSHLLGVEFEDWNGSLLGHYQSWVSPLSLLEPRLACLLAVVASRSSLLLHCETRKLLYRGVWQGSRCLWHQLDWAGLYWKVMKKQSGGLQAVV